MYLTMSKDHFNEHSSSEMAKLKLEHYRQSFSNKWNSLRCTIYFRYAIWIWCFTRGLGEQNGRSYFLEMMCAMHVYVLFTYYIFFLENDTCVLFAIVYPYLRPIPFWFFTHSDQMERSGKKSTVFLLLYLERYRI